MDDSLINSAGTGQFRSARTGQHVRFPHLAHKMADEKGLKITVLGTNIEPEVIYHKAHKSVRDCGDCSADVAHTCADG